MNLEALAALDVVGSEPSLALDELVEEYKNYEQLLSIQASIINNQETVQSAKIILRAHS